MDNSKDKLQSVFLGILVTGLALICLTVIMFGVKLIETKEMPTAMAEAVVSLPTAEATAITATETTNIPQDSEGMTTLQTLENTLVPENDPLELAARFNGVSDPRAHMKEPAAARANGSQQSFWILDVDSNDYRQITAVLAY